MKKFCWSALSWLLLINASPLLPSTSTPAAWAQNVSARNKFKVGRAMFDKGDYKKAIESFEQAIQEDPNFPDPHFHMGLSYFGLKNYDKAKEKLTYVMQQDPTFFPAYKYLGQVYVAQKKYKEAKELFQRMLMVPKAAATATYCLGVLAYAQEDLKEAERLFREALRQDPKMASARNNLGVMQLAEKRYGEAFNNFAEAGRLEPAHPGFLVFQAIALIEQGDKTRPRPILDKAKRLSDKRHDWGFLGEACSQWMDGHYDKVVLACDKALERNPEMTEALIFKARALENLKKPEEARKVWEAVVADDPNVKEAKLAVERLKPAEVSPSATPTPGDSPTPSASPKPSNSPTPKPGKSPTSTSGPK